MGGESELVIYFGGEAKPVMEAGYRILVAYSDILGNRHLQYFPMTFDGQDDVLKCTVEIPLLGLAFLSFRVFGLLR